MKLNEVERKRRKTIEILKKWRNYDKILWNFWEPVKAIRRIFRFILRNCKSNFMNFLKKFWGLREKFRRKFNKLQVKLLVFCENDTVVILWKIKKLLFIFSIVWKFWEIGEKKFEFEQMLLFYCKSCIPKLIFFAPSGRLVLSGDHNGHEFIFVNRN